MRLVGLLLHSVIFVRKAGTCKGIDILKYIKIIYPIGIEANTTDVRVMCSICYLFPYEPRCEKRVFGVMTRSDTYQPVQP